MHYIEVSDEDISRDVSGDNLKVQRKVNSHFTKDFLQWSLSLAKNYLKETDYDYVRGSLSSEKM